MSAKRNFFPLLAVILITVLALGASAITKTLIIQQPDQKKELADQLSDPLAYVAIGRVRSLDMQSRWLEVESDSTEAIRSYIEESLSNTIRTLSEPLTRDSNLAWLVNYKGKTYRHNWKDEYSSTEGALDYTLRVTNGHTTYSGMIIPSTPFDRNRSMLVNPALVPTDRLAAAPGGEYSYQLLLPDDFSIHFYVPVQLESNGGPIARMAANFSHTGRDFALICGSGIIALFALFVRWKWEEGFRPLLQFSHIKALLAWLLLAASIGATLWANIQLGVGFASGELRAFFDTVGFSKGLARAAADGTAFVLWALYFFLILLAMLYVKSIFARGVANYLREDSLTSALMIQYRKQMMGALESNGQGPAFGRLFWIGVSLVVGLGAAITLCSIFFGEVGALVMGIGSLLFVVVLFWSVFKLQNKNYMKVYHATCRLAAGDFDDLQPQQTGVYQPLYQELMHISDSYQQALKEGLASQIAKTQLISNVSHDLKTPIAGIQSYSELIGLSDNIQDIKLYASHLENYAERLNNLIEDLFNVAKATSGDIQLDLQDIDLAELVMQVKSEWEDQLAKKNLKVILNLCSNSIVRLDPFKTVRVIDNLFANISKYSLENSRVFVSLTRQDGLYWLIFKNTSKVEMDFQPEEIVERFTRGDASRHESGSGLGLAIVKSFVEVMAGTFEVVTDGDLFKAILSFPIPPKPQVPDLPVRAVEAPRPAETEEEEENETVG